MYARTAYLIVALLLLQGNSSFATDYEIEGLLVKEKEQFTGIVINPGTRRQQFIAMDFSKTELANKRVKTKITLPVLVRICAGLGSDITKGGQALWLKPLMPNESLRAYDILPNEFVRPCREK